MTDADQRQIGQDNAASPMSHTTRVRAQIDSHNFGKLEINENNARGAILSFEMEKSTRDVGSFTMILAPFREWLDLLAADDLVNVYVNLGQSFKDDNVYNVGWVRLFFGYINDVRRIEQVNTQGVFTIRYQVSCSDFQKAVEKTEIYNNPFLDARETFGNNLVGSYLYRLGVSNAGNPRFLVMNHLASILGFGRQWLLPPHYDDRLPTELSVHRAPYDDRSAAANYSAPNVRRHFARNRVRNDALEKVQQLRALALRFSLIMTESLRGTTVDKIKQLPGLASDAATKEPVDADVINAAAFDVRLQMARSADELPAPYDVQQTIDVEAPHQSPRSLFDVLSFDYMEYTDGWMFSISIWEHQGPLIELLRRVSNDILNELIFDLRPAIDFHRGETDGLGQEMDGAVCMVPSVVLREYPYTTFPRGGNFEDRLVDFSSIRVPLETSSLVPASEDLELAQAGAKGGQAEKFVVPTMVDWGGAVWSQQERVTDYGYSVGIDSESPFTEDSTSSERNMLFDRGPRTFESIQITSNDVISASIGRGDQDLITGFEFIPQTELAENQKYWNRELAPLFRLLLIRRHGLRMLNRSSEFSSFAAVSLLGTSTQDIDTTRFGPISSKRIGPSLSAYMTLRIVTICDHWYQHNIEYLNGTLTLRPMPGLRVGYRLDWVDRGLSFYVESVAHKWNFPNMMTTQVQVSRGQPLNNPLDYQLPNDRIVKEFADSFRLGINFPVADPEGFEEEITRRRVNSEPGMPGRYSPHIIFDNLKTMVVPFPDGVNKAIRLRGREMVFTDDSERPENTVSET